MPLAEHRVVDPTVALSILILELILFAYFLFTNAIYIGTSIVALSRLPRFMKLRSADPIRASYSPFELPVSVLVPAYNESEGIVQTVESLLHLEYSEYEIIVINDGSSDETLQLLIDRFELVRFPQVPRVAIPTQEIRGFYQSKLRANLRVVDKKNGGKGDALNAGINVSRYPLVFACDGDSYYSRDALQCMIEPYLSDPKTVVVGASIGISNDCEFSDGRLVKRRLSKRWIVRFQVLEYLRAYLGSRLGWAPFNGVSIVSGACGLWRKSVLIEVGGYRTDTIWEDFEMTLRVHHYLRKHKRPYVVAFTPFSVCWTQVPDTAVALWHQRVGWHRHISECMWLHRGLLFSGYGGSIAWLGLPYLWLCEWLAPYLVLFGVLFGVLAAVTGVLAWHAQVVLLALVLSLAVLTSVCAVLLDELSFVTYSDAEMATLIFATVLEVFGFRQLVTAANAVGLWQWLRRDPIRKRRNVVSLRSGPYDPFAPPPWHHSSG